MELKLSQNIKARRKKCGFTQEQLAEAMGVSVGTVSKWESGISYPDIEMVAALADFFQESVDALLGYQWEQSSAGQTARRLKALRGERRYEEGLAEVKSALQKFPYQSDVLYECGELLFQSTIAQTHPAARGSKTSERNLLLAVDVFEKTIQLLEQNHNPAVSKTDIHQKIGTIYGVLGQKEAAVSYLEQHNSSHLNDWMISNFLTDLKQYPRAWELAAEMFQRRAFELFQCYWVMYAVLINTEKYNDLLEFAVWMEQFCLSLQDNASLCSVQRPSKTARRPNSLQYNKSGYYVRATAITEAMIATVYAYKGTAEHKDYAPDIRNYLQKAAKHAEIFDNFPDYSGKTRFTNCCRETLYDGHGKSAVLAIQDVILYSRENEAAFFVLRSIYNNIAAETGHTEWNIPDDFAAETGHAERNIPDDFAAETGHAKWNIPDDIAMETGHAEWNIPDDFAAESSHTKRRSHGNKI